MTCRRTIFPFTAIVGQGKMKKALILNAINPSIGGVLIRGEKGTAKSTAVRALADLLPEIEVVKDCVFGCNPHNPLEMCKNCMERINKKEELPIIKRKMKVVDLPLGATEDRVLGTIDIENAIKKGEKIFEPGILAEANRGILYVDEVNLLDDHLVDVLLDSAAMGVNIVEREGISFSHPAKFILVGTMNPEEGELRPQLLDRFGLCVNVETIKDGKERVEIIKRCIEFEKDPHSFEKKWEKEQKKLAEKIIKAKEILNKVKYSDEILDLIAKICIDMEVDGHRADIFILKVAKTICAYHLRYEVTEDDVKEAAELVLSHRMRKTPFEEPKLEKEKIEQSIQKQKDKMQNSQKEEHHNTEEKKKKDKETKPDATGETTFNIGDVFKVKNIGIKMKEEKSGSGRRVRTKTEDKSGKYTRSEIPKKYKDDIAIDATLRAAAPYQKVRGERVEFKEQNNMVIIEPQDIRCKVREKKVGNIILFLVDSSGSMGANRRMIETKGAIMSLLIDAYQKRDKVGLVAFKGNKAEVLLPPTQSVELAKKKLQELPTGGKTPLSKGLLKSLEIFKTLQKKSPKYIYTLILITDGRANVSTTNKNPVEEAKEVASLIKKEGIKSVVVDTEKDFINFGYAKEIAEKLGANYYKVEDIKSEFLVDIVKKTIN